MSKKSALGKGIASLIGPNTSVPAQKEILKKKTQEKIEETGSIGPALVDINSIIENTYQPRRKFVESELTELSASIKENGIIQPLIVTKIEKGYELIAGERRLRASKMAGLKKVPVILKRATDRDKLVMAIIENVQRSDLNCIEEALAYHRLMSDFKLTQEEVAKRVGKERSSVSNLLRILKLPHDVVSALQENHLSLGHAKLLVSLKDIEKVKRLANEVMTKNLSVRELEKLIKSSKNTPKKTAQNPFFDEKLDQLKDLLEKRTGLHFAINSKGKGQSGGQIIIKYANEAEFNDIYEYLMK